MAGESAGAAIQEALFPSPQLRAIPSFSFDFPAGWELEEITGALAAVHPPEPIDGFWVNVLVDHDRVEAAAGLKEAAVITCAHVLRLHPDLRVLTERLAQFDGGRRETYIRVAEMTDEGRKLTQMHALFFAPEIPGARTKDLFQIIATIPSDDDDANDAIGVQVIDIVKSFRFESGRALSHTHDHDHAHDQGERPQPATDDPREFWEGFYGDRDQVWSGRPNVVLVDEVTSLAPGTALDLGCGEGADAIWLAQRGWQVTATDISQVALDRGRVHATEAGVADHITWERHDFSQSIPTGPFDLVSAHFLHSPVDDPHDSALRAAAATVALGGTLLVVSHESVPWHPEVVFPTPAEVLESLGTDPADWVVENVRSQPRRAKSPEGGDVDVSDSIVRLRRV